MKAEGGGQERGTQGTVLLPQAHGSGAGTARGGQTRALGVAAPGRWGRSWIPHLLFQKVARRRQGEDVKMGCVVSPLSPGQRIQMAQEVLSALIY